MDTYKYLGHMMHDQKGTHDKMPQYLASQANKALFSLQGKMSSSFGYISPVLAIKMFDSYILPILEYNNMLWCKKSQHSDIEKIQLGYLKNVLNVRRQTPTVAIYAETGRFPLQIRQKISTIKYWARLREMPDYDLLNKCLKIQEQLYEKGQKNWFNNVVQIITEINIPEWQHMETKKLVNNIKLTLYENEQTRILENINDSNKFPKLRTYKTFKNTYCLERYLTLNLPKKTLNNIARFRVSSHNLKIETGRHENPKLPIENRTCDKCKSSEIEDELHCLIICSHNTTPRNNLFLKASSLINNFNNLDESQKFCTLMSSREPDIIYALGKFLDEVL